MKLSIEYHRKWLLIGLAAGFLNFIAGIIVGAGMWTDQKLEKEGKIVVVASLAWGIIAVLIVRLFAPQSV